MRKVLLTILTVFGVASLSAQTSFGIVGGFNELIMKASTNQATVSVGGSGFFVGVFTEFTSSKQFKIQPEVLYARSTREEGSVNQLVVPIMGKYYVAEGLSLQGGPLMDFVLDKSDEVYKFGFGLALGVGYDFSNKVFMSSRYSFGITQRVKANSIPGVATIPGVNFNFFQVGLGYRF